MASIKNPDNVEDLTPQWFHQILNLDDTQSDKYKFEITPNAGEGGFVCNIIRVKVKLEKYIDYRQLIIKLLHHVEFYRELALREKFDITEINFYQHVVPALTKLMPGLEKFLCGHVYSNVSTSEDPAAGSRTSVLVLEDMKPLGYRILGFKEEYTMEQVRSGIDFLSKFHTACRLLEKNRSGTLPQVFGLDVLPNFNLNGGVFAGKWKELIPDGYPRFDEFLRTYEAPGVTKKTKAEVLAAHAINPEQITARAFDALIQIIDEGKTHATITHLDLWRCNILIRFGINEFTLHLGPNLPMAPDSNLPAVKIIDWQTVFYVDGAYDLSTYLLSTLPIEQLARPVVDGLAQEYYKLYSSELAASCGTERSLEEFMQTFSTYSMAFALMWFMQSYETNPELPDYHPRFWKVTQLLYLEYDINLFVKDVLMTTLPEAK